MLVTDRPGSALLVEHLRAVTAYGPCILLAVVESTGQALQTGSGPGPKRPQEAVGSSRSLLVRRARTVARASPRQSPHPQGRATRRRRCHVWSLSARTSVSVGPLCHRRERRTFRLRAPAPIPLLSHSACLAPAGREPRTSQPISRGRQEVAEPSLCNRRPRSLAAADHRAPGQS
jgi:hypothetical protein